MRTMKSEQKPNFQKSFEALFQEKKYPHAFIVASKYPELKNTPQYAEMQEHFNTLLKLAALHIKRDQAYRARELIGEYARIEEKRVLVKLLLAFGEEFLQFLKAVSDKELEVVFSALELHPDFAKVPSFIVLKEQMTEQLAFLEKIMDTMELRSDFSLLWEWENFLPDARRLQKKLADLQRLQKHYEKEEWNACYEMIESENAVQNSLLARLLQKHWHTCFKRAKSSAERGDMEDVYRTVKDFLPVASKRESIKLLFYTAAKRRIADLIRQKAYKEAERLLFEAVEYFGRQPELMELAERYFECSGVRVVFG